MTKITKLLSIGLTLLSFCFSCTKTRLTTPDSVVSDANTDYKPVPMKLSIGSSEYIGDLSSPVSVTWMVAKNALGLYQIMSQDNITVDNNLVQSISHGSSYMRRIVPSPCEWIEDNVIVSPTSSANASVNGYITVTGHVAVKGLQGWTVSGGHTVSAKRM